jgi:hypothetical protein
MQQRFFVFLLIGVFSSLNVKAQKIGVGTDAMYNFQSEGFGVGGRVSIFPNRRLSYVPQFAYYFPFNKVNEAYAGLALEYKVIKRKKINCYLIAHGAFDYWMNYKESPMKDAKKKNWDLEGGAGISGAKCLRPFIEYRYNIKFQETHLRLGILYIFGCKNNKKYGFGSGGDAKDRRCGNYD